jgi:hypothetical protein
MNFLHLWALGIGAGALVVPVAVHFLTKPKPLTYPLSTIRFLVEIVEQKRARSRLRDFLVLLLRMLAIGLLAMALARPWLNNTQGIEAMPTNVTARVILLDVSQSMAAKRGASSAIDQAKSIALKYLEYSPNLQANLVLVGAKPRPVFPSLSPNLSILREAVQSSTPRCERSDIKSAMTVAGNMLSASPLEKTELIIISDFQRTNWSNLFLETIPSSTKILLESVASEAENNIAITAFRLGGRAIVDSEVLLEIDVANYTDQDAVVRATVDLDALEASIELSGKINSQSTSTLTAPIKLGRAQWVTGWVELRENSDAMPADDARPIAFQVEKPPKMVLLSNASKGKQADGTFFLEQALQVIAGATKVESTLEKRTEQDRLVVLSTQRSRSNELSNTSELSDADIFVFNHCGELAPDLIATIAARVRKGKGLLYFAGDVTDSVNLELLSREFGTGYQPPVQLIPPDNDLRRKDLFVRDIRTRYGPFAIFGEQAGAAMQTTRIGGGLASHALESGLKDQVLAELSDSSPLVFLTSCDAGNVAVVNADLDQSNWCSQPSFFPVLSELISAVYAKRNTSWEANGGEPLIRQLPNSIPETANLIAEVADKRSPSSDVLGALQWNANQECYTWAWTDPIGPGNFQIKNTKEIVSAVAIAAPSMESDPKCLVAEVLQGRLAGTRSIGFRDAASTGEKSDQWWNWLIVACVLGLASEIFMLRWFSS